MGVLKFLGGDNEYHALPIGGTQSAVLPEYYSENEIVIGKWVDGRPIYRKVFVKQNYTIAKGVTTVPLNVSVQEGIHAFAVGMNNNGANFWLPNIHPSTIGSQASIVIRSNDVTYASATPNTIEINSGTVRTFTRAFIVAEYTKTTDAPDSFTLDMLENTMELDEHATDDEVNACLI